MGLLAGDGKPVASTIWYVIAVFSFVGVGLILITVGYIHRALNRQRLITKELISEGLWKKLEFAEPKQGRIWWLKPKNLLGLRLDWAPLLVYGVAGAFSIVFAVCGDPFGLTTNS
jgi:hypothetical protein